MGEKINTPRMKAIKDVYGMKNVLAKKSITIVGGETITAWVVEGFETFEDLQNHIPLPDIEAIYDNGE